MHVLYPELYLPLYVSLDSFETEKVNILPRHSLLELNAYPVSQTHSNDPGVFWQILFSPEKEAYT